MSSTADTDERLGPLLEHFAERLNQVWAHFCCALEFEGDKDADGDPIANLRAWRLLTIANGCSSASLIAIRDLDDFFTPRTSRTHQTDLRASDFGYYDARGFLAVAERNQINTLIAHTTVAGPDHQGLRWDIWELASKCIAQSTSFLRWIESHYSITHLHLFTAAMTCRMKTQETSRFVAEAIERRRADKRRVFLQPPQEPQHDHDRHDDTGQ